MKRLDWKALLFVVLFLGACAANQIIQHQQLVVSTSKLATVAFLQKNPGSTERMGVLIGRLTSGVSADELVTVEQVVGVVDLYLAEAKLDPMTRLAVTELTATATAEVLAALKNTPEGQQLDSYKPALQGVLGSMKAGLDFWLASPEWAAWKEKYR